MEAEGAAGDHPKACVEALDNGTGKLTFCAEPVQQQ